VGGRWIGRTGFWRLCQGPLSLPQAALSSLSLPTGRVVKPAKAFPRASPRVSNKVKFLKTHTYKPIEVIPGKKDPHCAPAIPQH